MKKILLALLFLTLYSCSSNKQIIPEDQADQTTTFAITETESVTQTTTEPEHTATEIPPAPVTEPPTETEINEVLYNDNGIEIYYQGIDQNVANLYIVNTNEDLPVHAWMQNIYVNDVYLENVGCEGYAAENVSNKWPCILSLEELQNSNITRINELKFTIIVNLGDNFISETEEFTITR